MTTAPTPAAAAIADLLEYLDDGGLHFDGQPLPDAAAIELRRLQAENVRLQGSLEAQRLISDRAIALAKELEASKNASIHKLEMDALDLASENSILKRQEQAELEARKPLPADTLTRHRVLEEAAKVCDDLPVPGEFQRDGAWAWEKGCDAAADAIRAMKDKP